MKKKLIALAVTGAMPGPMIAQADATLYCGIKSYHPNDNDWRRPGKRKMKRQR